MDKQITFVLASKNKHKAEEIKAILGDGFDVITQDAAGFGDIDVAEDGTTFEQNAVKKANTIMKASNMPVIADDSGLCVDALNGAPGVYTARYAGENATDKENIDKLLAALDELPLMKRTAQFVCVIAVAVPGKSPITFRGECKGLISLAPAGNCGFGYDPVFYLPNYDKTMGELEPQIKNAISHRAVALKKLVKKIRK